MNQIPVNWVKKGTLHEKSIPVFEANYIPVIPLSALREVVEGLKEINAKSVIAYSIAPELSATACLEINSITQRLLAVLGEGKP